MTTHATESDPEVGLTVAVLAHAEGRLLRPMLRSVAAAIERAVDAGATCELLVMLDTATAETVTEAQRWTAPGLLPAPVRIQRIEVGDAGAARNAAAAHARGTYLAVCDGDDLISDDYLATAWRMLSDTEGPLIVHPAIVLSFGARAAVWHLRSTDEIDFHDLIRQNQWPSASVALRSLHLAHPSVPLDPGSGLGPEDWLWNIETVLAGIPHRLAAGSMYFYRVRESGGVNNRHMSSILPPFDLARLREVLPELPERAAQRRAANEQQKSFHASLRFRRYASGLARAVAAPLPAAAKGRLYRAGRRLFHSVQPALEVPDEVLPRLLAAADLEPALSWTANGYAALPEWVDADDVYSELLIALHDALEGVTAVVAVPWVGIGGADIVSLNYAKALADLHGPGAVAMLATYDPAKTIVELVPEEVRFVQVPESFRTLTPELQRRLLAQLLLQVAPELVVSVNCFDVTHSLQRFGRAMGDAIRIFPTLFAWERVGAGFPVNPMTDDGLRTYLDDIRGVLTDNPVTARELEDRLALRPEQIRIHHQPAMPDIPPLNRETRAYLDASDYTPQRPFRLLWPHRLDVEKRPDALVAIAERLRADGLPVSIHVHGQQVLSTTADGIMASLKSAGIEYHGPYRGGLAALPTADYHAMLLTSQTEGMPLVVVQSMLLGLPVLATDVGGVGQMVVDGETGMLVRGPDDTDGFVAAVRRLMDEPQLRKTIIEGAYARAVERHSWEAFRREVESLSVDP